MTDPGRFLRFFLKLALCFLHHLVVPLLSKEVLSFCTHLFLLKEDATQLELLPQAFQVQRFRLLLQ